MLYRLICCYEYILYRLYKLFHESVYYSDSRCNFVTPLYRKEINEFVVVVVLFSKIYLSKKMRITNNNLMTTHMIILKL